MSFLKRQPSKRKKCALSLQALSSSLFSHRIKMIFPQIRYNPQTNSNSFSKRIFFVIPKTHTGSNKGSITVEAAFVLPLFIFAMLSIISFMEILRVQMKINSSLQQTAKEMAIYAHVGEEMLDIGDSVPAFAKNVALSETYVRSKVVSDLTVDYLQHSPIQGASKLSFMGSKILEDDCIELRCDYAVMPFFALSKGAGFITESTAVVHAFTGYDNTKYTSSNATEQQVYITETGSVYHKNRDCHYLDLSIRQVEKDELYSLRNYSDGRYKACPLCAKHATSANVYVTNYGDCYHYDLQCSGLKRTIKEVSLCDVEGMHPCSKCGKD